MAKISRNAPCPCGSGKKYKKCCLPAEEAVAAEAAVQQRSRIAEWAANFEDDDDPTDLSNEIIDLIDAGKLDEAETACAELKERFPEIIDWIERTGMIYEARGENEKAIESYRQCLVYIEEHRDLYDDGFENWYLRSIKKLEERVASRGGGPTGDSPTEEQSR